MIRGSTRRNLLRRTRKNVIDTHRSRFHHMRAPVTNVHLAHPARAEGGLDLVGVLRVVFSTSASRPTLFRRQQDFSTSLSENT